MVYNEELLDRFVRESTDFESWEQMVKSAVDLRFPRKCEETETESNV